MIHILTVHWEDEQWVDIQLRYIKKHIKEPFKIYAFLNRLPSDHSDKFFYSSTEDIASHGIKLNLLADMASLHAKDENDRLLFIDGDAFPIGDIIQFADQKLKDHPLVAIQRLENNGDDQPHPCFCYTTIKFWKQIKGDWTNGHVWKNSLGKEVHDVGGRILAKLKEGGHSWYPILRSNKIDLHPLWFGVYGDLIYHHGAGFRRQYARVDRPKGFFINLNFYPFNKFRKMRIQKIAKINGKLALEEFDKLKNDDKFYEAYQGITN